MLLRFLILGGLTLAIIVPAMSFSLGTADKSCRQHPQLVGNCFNVHGRLSVYNGAPALRIRKIGTPRILGVSEQRFAMVGYRNVPEDIQSKIDQDKLLFGDFLVCPFTRQKNKEMQLVCIERVTNLVVKKR
jgi:hypothetical protein